MAEAFKIDPTVFDELDSFLQNQDHEFRAVREYVQQNCDTGGNFGVLMAPLGSEYQHAKTSVDGALSSAGQAVKSQAEKVVLVKAMWSDMEQQNQRDLQDLQPETAAPQGGPDAPSIDTGRGPAERPGAPTTTGGGSSGASAQPSLPPSTPIPDAPSLTSDDPLQVEVGGKLDVSLIGPDNDPNDTSEHGEDSDEPDGKGGDKPGDEDGSEIREHPAGSGTGESGPGGKHNPENPSDEFWAEFAKTDPLHRTPEQLKEAWANRESIEIDLEGAAKEMKPTQAGFVSAVQPATIQLSLWGTDGNEAPLTVTPLQPRSL